MRKLVIIALVVLVYSSVFPTYLFAEDNGSAPEVDAEEQVNNVESESNPEKDKETTESANNTDSAVKVESVEESEEEDAENTESEERKGETNSEEENNEVLETDQQDTKEESEESGTDTEDEATSKQQSETAESADIKKTETETSSEEKETVEKSKTAEEDREEDTAEYNQFGIKKGTTVYGIDISKFTEKELQYVPEGWRDGVVESEHQHDTGEGIVGAKRSYPDVNSYISNLPVANVEYQFKNFFTQFNYRNGFGKVEGVVAHETANDYSTITSEISYMSQNHRNAFVHAFVDDERVIQIHPLDLGAWGAGPYANQRFVHVELVRVSNFDQFAKSINNYADYIASILYNYGLGVNSAESDGQGTLWSHKAVSNYLGGTTHVDPHGYFARYGYSWNQFISLVRSRYDNFERAKANTSRLGHLHGDARIFKYAGVSSSAVSAENYTSAVYYIKAQTEAKGDTYYLISRLPSSQKGVIGWVKAKDMNTYAHTGVDSRKKTFYVRGSGSAYSKAWGGPKDVIYSDLSNYVGQEVNIDLTEKVGSNYWYRGTLNGETVWIHTSNLTTKQESSTSKLGHLHGNATIFQQIGDNRTAFSASPYTNAVYYIKKQAKVNDQIYYLISNKPSSSRGVIGWVKSQDMDVHSHRGLDSNSKTFSIEGSGSAYATAWGGKKDLVYDNLANFKNAQFKVNLTETVGNNTWYRGVLNGKTVWVHSSYVTAGEESRVSKLGHLRGSAQIYETAGDTSTTFSADNYTNAVYYIKKQTKMNGKTYFLISRKPSSTSGTIGWVEKSDMVTYNHASVDHKAKTFEIVGKGSAFSKAWGGSKNLVIDDLGKYKSRIFKVNLTETVGNNTWYRGTIDGKTAWIHSAYLK
ncbi:GW dipeptide domain-containing protein [Sediminibacillus massiliensis]|uniref:GW dipeptide domain-containing protein n=1 Tax=Sediminibacillus massiliensis TaxID=1926277 RepID=UPI0009887FF4|nr:N-acetylmuramoyl-L-alanine amidase [Sediminibacillus massiliensis]